MTNHDIAFWEQKLVGKTLVRGVSAQATNENQVTEAELPPVHRILSKNSIMTMDFRTDRLNVYIDDDNKITRVMFC
ncbi:hypothetical protein GGF31_003496 [Allomyces arbusculus]|nr:hypothetical protein GGF31_003496 [Allomyces arbusculus]